MREFYDNDVEATRSHFAKHGTVFIPDVVPRDTLMELREALLHHSAQAHWVHASKRTDGAEPQLVPDVPKNLPTIVANRAAARPDGYSFTRTVDDALITSYSMMNVRALLNTDGFLGLMRRVTGMPLAVAEPLFVSKFVTGDFMHMGSLQGAPERQVAFELNLTLNWREEYGGNLTIAPSADSPWEKDVQYVAAPDFNSLALFDVRNGGHAHGVERVTEKSDRTRLAVFGWLSSDKPVQPTSKLDMMYSLRRMCPRGRATEGLEWWDDLAPAPGRPSRVWTIDEIMEERMRQDGTARALMIASIL